MQFFKVFKLFKNIFVVLCLCSLGALQAYYPYYNAGLTDNYEVDLLEQVVNIYMQKGTIPTSIEYPKPGAQLIEETDPILYSRCIPIISSVVGAHFARSIKIYKVPSSSLSWTPELAMVPAFATQSSIYFTEHFFDGQYSESDRLHDIAHEAGHIKHQHDRRKTIAIHLLKNLSREASNPSVYTPLTEQERRLIVALYYKATPGRTLLEQQGLLHERQADLEALNTLNIMRITVPQNIYKSNGSMHPERQRLCENCWHIAYSSPQFSDLF